LILLISFSRLKFPVVLSISVVWASIPFFSAFFCCEVFVSVTGTSAFCVLMTGVSVDFVLVGCVSVVLVLTVCFSTAFELPHLFPPLAGYFFTGVVVKRSCF
jgi:hypothetical protein